MATGSTSPISVKAEQPQTPVKEVITDVSIRGERDKDDEFLEKYIQKDASFGAPLPYISIPTIDVELLSSSSSQEELEKLRSALTTCGCFQIVNHGISSALLNDIRDVTREFFSLPPEQKRNYETTPVNDFEGYGSHKFASDKNQLLELDWTEVLYLVTHPVAKRRLQLWPQQPQPLSENLNDYSSKCRELLDLVLKAMASSLGVAGDGSFKDQVGEEARLSAKFMVYPKCPRPDRILGIKPHTDGSVMTILLQDRTIEGLQVLKNEQWFKVPAAPDDALLINAGDQLEIMSNGIFKSPKHRVVTDAEKERISVAMFCFPDDESEIGPVKELINKGQGRPQMYKRIKNYRAFATKHYLMGQHPLSALKLQ